MHWRERALDRLGPLRGALVGGIAVAILFALVLVALIAFVPAIRESGAWSSIVSGLLGAALATIVQLFIGPAVKRQERRAELKDQSRLEMLAALDGKLRPALNAYRVELALVEETAAMAANPSKHPGVDVAALQEAALKRFAERRRHTLVDAQHEVFVAHLFSLDDPLQEMWDPYEQDMRTLMFPDPKQGEAVSPSDLTQVVARVEQRRLTMYEHLFRELTGWRGDSRR